MIPRSAVIYACVILAWQAKIICHRLIFWFVQLWTLCNCSFDDYLFLKTMGRVLKWRRISWKVSKQPPESQSTSIWCEFIDYIVKLSLPLSSMWVVTFSVSKVYYNLLTASCVRLLKWIGQLHFTHFICFLFHPFYLVHVAISVIGYADIFT